MGGPGSGKKPREYPPEVVALLCGLYEAGHTVAEIRALAPKGVRVQTVLERYLPARRPSIPRDQRGPRNACWRGSAAGYQAIHLRLGRAADHACADCGAPARDWSYLHGCPDEQRRDGSPAYCDHVEHYVPRCVPCHRAYDRKGVMPNV